MSHPNRFSAIARVVVTCALGAASVHFAAAQEPQTQQGSTTTRQAQKADLKKLEQNGYKPGADNAYYPQNIQNAERKAYGGSTASAPAAPGSGG